MRVKITLKILASVQKGGQNLLRLPRRAGGKKLVRETTQFNANKWKRMERTLSHDSLPPRQSVRLNGDLRAASLGAITTGLQPISVKHL